MLKIEDEVKSLPRSLTNFYLLPNICNKCFWLLSFSCLVEFSADKLVVVYNQAFPCLQDILAVDLNHLLQGKRNSQRHQTVHIKFKVIFCSLTIVGDSTSVADVLHTKVTSLGLYEQAWFMQTSPVTSWIKNLVLFWYSWQLAPKIVLHHCCRFLMAETYQSKATGKIATVENAWYRQLCPCPT